LPVGSGRPGAYSFPLTAQALSRRSTSLTAQALSHRSTRWAAIVKDDHAVAISALTPIAAGRPALAATWGDHAMT